MITLVALSGLVVVIASVVLLEGRPRNQVLAARALAGLAGLVTPSRRQEFAAELHYLQRELGQPGLSYAFGACTASFYERLIARWHVVDVGLLRPVARPRILVPGGAIVGLIAARASGRSTISRVVVRADPEVAGNAVEVADVGRRADEQVRCCGDDLVESMTVAENLLINRPNARCRTIVSPARARSQAKQVLAELGITGIEPDRPVHQLSRPDRALVGLAAASQKAASTIVFEDPNLSLAGRRRVVEVLDRIRQRGTGVVLVSHDIDEICSVADEVTVLRNGDVVVQAHTADLSPDDVVRYLLGG